MEERKKVNPAIIAIIVIAVLALVAAAVFAATQMNEGGNESSDTPASTSESTQTSTDEAATPSETGEYTNGTYTATGSYVSPGGQESIELTVTLEDGVITNSSLVTNADNRDSRQYQNMFASNYKTLVVGKDIDEVSLSRVSGSSLTSTGFNNALDQIKEDAKL